MACTLDVLGPSDKRRRVSGITLVFNTNRLFQSACCAKTPGFFFPIGTYPSKYRALREYSERERYRNCLVLCRDVRERLQKKRSSAPAAKSYDATPGDLSDFLPTQPQVVWFRAPPYQLAVPPCAARARAFLMVTVSHQTRSPKRHVSRQWSLGLKALLRVAQTLECFSGGGLRPGEEERKEERRQEGLNRSTQANTAAVISRPFAGGRSVHAVRLNWINPIIISRARAEASQTCGSKESAEVFAHAHAFASCVWVCGFVGLWVGRVVHGAGTPQDLLETRCECDSVPSAFIGAGLS